MAWASLKFDTNATVKAEVPPEEQIVLLSSDGEEFTSSRDLLKYIKALDPKGKL